MCILKYWHASVSSLILYTLKLGILITDNKIHNAIIQVYTLQFAFGCICFYANMTYKCQVEIGMILFSHYEMLFASNVRFGYGPRREGAHHTAANYITVKLERDKSLKYSNFLIMSRSA